MRWALLALGVVLGVLLLGAVRFSFLQPPSVHYHANFAVMIDGERLDLSGDRYMEDVSACSADPDAVRPEDRAHLHENNPDVVHVHHGGATWGHLFANLGLGLGEDYLILPGGERYFSGEEGRQVSFVANGMQVPDLHNRLIRSEDRVLVSVSRVSSPEALLKEFSTVAENAGEYNTTQDPAGCAGSREWTFGQRIRNAFWTL